MNVKYLWIAVILTLSNLMYAQNEDGIRSKLIDQHGTPIIAAWVSINHSTTKVQTDENGYFLLKTSSWPAHLDIDMGDNNVVHVDIANEEEAKVITAKKVVELHEVVVKEKVTRE